MFSSLSPLFVDLYELTMAQVYLERGLEAEATFSLFVRRLPPSRSFLVAAGIGPLLSAVTELKFSEEHLEFLDSLKLFKKSFLEYLKNFKFEGDIWVLDEGTFFFENEPILEVTAPLPQAQLLETLVINAINVETAVATKALRCVLAAQGRPCVDFSARRTHGTEAALHVARASYIGGFSATSNVEAGRLFGIPVTGTMAHSYIEVFDSEESAFKAFAKEFPQNAVFLIDTYDTLKGAEAAVRVAKELEREGISVKAVRIDSGDLVSLSKRVREVLDRAGLSQVKIFVSGGIDEYEIDRLVRSGAPIDAFGVGTKMGVSADAPYLDIAYKLVDYDGRPKMKLSEGKVTYPGKKQVFRKFDEGSGRWAGDVVGLREEGQGLLKCAIREGRLVRKLPSLKEIRERVMGQLDTFPEALLKGEEVYKPEISSALKELFEKTKGFYA